MRALHVITVVALACAPTVAHGEELTVEQRKIVDDVVRATIMEAQARIVKNPELARNIAELARREKKWHGYTPAMGVGWCAQRCRAQWVPVPAAINEKVVDDIIFQYRNPGGTTDRIDERHRDREHKRHREGCAGALAMIGHPKGVPAIIECLEKDGGIFAWAALAGMADERLIPAINKHLDLKSQQKTLPAIRCLAKLGKAAIPTLQRILTEGDRAMKGAAIEALAQIGLPECLPPLEQLRDSKQPKKLHGLVAQDLPPAIATLRCRAIDKTFVPPDLPYQDRCRLHHLVQRITRGWSAQSEARPDHADKQHIDDLLERGKKAEAALLKIDKRIAAAAIRPILAYYEHIDGPERPHWTVSPHAADFMVKIGEPAIPALLDALNDKYPHARKFAAAALQRITGQDHGTQYAQWRQWCLKANKIKSPPA